MVHASTRVVGHNVNTHGGRALCICGWRDLTSDPRVARAAHLAGAWPILIGRAPIATYLERLAQEHDRALREQHDVASRDGVHGPPRPGGRTSNRSEAHLRVSGRVDVLEHALREAPAYRFD